MRVSDADMLKHELAHAFGGLMSGARFARITLGETEARTKLVFDREPDFKRDELPAIIAGRAHVVPGMDLSEDEAQIAQYADELVARIEAGIVPMVRARLAGVDEADIAAMLRVIKRDGGIELEGQRYN